jgi:hypothetical protein
VGRPIGGFAIPLATGDVLIAGSVGWYGFRPDDGTDGPPIGLDGVLFHPATGLFTDLPSSPSLNAFNDMVALADGRVLLLGFGRGTAAWIGDPATGEARRTARINPSVVADGDAAWTGVRLADGRVLVAIGSLGPTAMFDPAAGRFTRIRGAAGTADGDPAHRAVVRMTLLADGRVFLTRWIDDPPFQGAGEIEVRDARRGVDGRCAGALAHLDLHDGSPAATLHQPRCLVDRDRGKPCP